MKVGLFQPTAAIKMDAGRSGAFARSAWMDSRIRDIGKALAEQLTALTANAAALRRTDVCIATMRPAPMPAPPISIFPRFIKKIASQNLRGSAQTIFASNLLGATCARVCPVQELCEGAMRAGRRPQAYRHWTTAAIRHGLRPRTPQLSGSESRADGQIHSRDRRRASGAFLRQANWQCWATR